MMGPALLLVLGACSSGTSDPEGEACYSIHNWTSGGGQAERFDDAMSETQEHLDASDHEDLIAAADELAASTEADRSAAAAAFIEQCGDLGWEPREG